MIDEIKIKIEKTATINVLGSIKNSNKIIIVLHGYGQLSKFFIRKFEPLINIGYTIIAPEGFSKFYLKGNNGRVGASWMTKENRIDEISDYVKFINSLNDELNLSGKEVSLLGFSQGGATAQRCYNENKLIYKKLIICSSTIIDDFEIDCISLYIIGDNDKYIDLKEVRKLIPKEKLIIFKGEHILNIESIKKGLLM